MARDNYKVTFEMVNGEKLVYEFENSTEEIIYEKFVNAPDGGWIEIDQAGEKHYISTDKIIRVKLLSQSEVENRTKVQEEAIQNLKW